MAVVRCLLSRPHTIDISSLLPVINTTSPWILSCVGILLIRSTRSLIIVVSTVKYTKRPPRERGTDAEDYRSTRDTRAQEHKSIRAQEHTTRLNSIPTARLSRTTRRVSMPPSPLTPGRSLSGAAAAAAVAAPSISLTFPSDPISF